MTTARQRSSLQVDADEFRQKFEREAFFLKPHISKPELFTREYLVEAAGRLPDNLLELNSGAVAKSALQSGGTEKPINIEDAILNSDSHNLWVGLKMICLLPEYQRVIDDMLDSVQTLVSERFPGMFRREGFIFLSSPGAVVPYHMDPEHNFLIQIQGTKTISVFEKSDRRIITDEDIERNYTLGHRKLTLALELERFAHKFELTPGHVLHIPISTPHYVVNGDRSCISLSVTFATPRAERRARVYKVNHHLRRMGFKPSPFGMHAGRDTLKSLLGNIYLGAQSLIGKHSN